MTHQLLVHPVAGVDIADARKWYDERRRGLGAEFVNEVDGVFARIAANPHLYPAVYVDVRRAVMRRFPYFVYFLVDDDVVRVIAVLHTRRRPELYRSRM